MRHVPNTPCEVCGALFYARPSDRANGRGRFCSLACKGKASRTREERTCRHCGRRVMQAAWKIAKDMRPYCSRTCFMADIKAKQQRTCPACGATFLPKRLKQKYCAPACSAAGKRRADPKVRSSHAYRTWRSAVLERDNFTCQHCGARGAGLSAHHVRGWNDAPALRFEVANGLTLCNSCHATLHGREHREAA